MDLRHLAWPIVEKLLRQVAVRRVQALRFQLSLGNTSSDGRDSSCDAMWTNHLMENQPSGEWSRRCLFDCYVEQITWLDSYRPPSPTWLLDKK